MNNVFIGGSRQISRLPIQVKERLNNIIENRHLVVIGDADGVDKSVQRHFVDANYEKVTVFCSGDKPRNNLRPWNTHNVIPPKTVKGFQFYAAKDREMASEADVGLMIWDGKSPGTVLNILRLIRAGKKALLININEPVPTTFKSMEDWNKFIDTCSPALLAKLKERATTEEYTMISNGSQRNFLYDQDSINQRNAETPSDHDLDVVVNAALSTGDYPLFFETLGSIARMRGMTKVAYETGLARESLYKSLGTTGNPEFTTVAKIIMALGYRLETRRDSR